MPNIAKARFSVDIPQSIGWICFKHLGEEGGKHDHAVEWNE
jgi:hypothetical protein